MKPARLLMLLGLACFVLAARPGETLRLGKIELTVPDGWTGRVDGEHIVLSVPGLPGGAQAEITLDKDLKSDSEFRAWFYDLWDGRLKRESVSKKGIPSWAQTNTSQAFIAVAELADGSRLVGAAYQTDQMRLLGWYRCSSQDLLAKGQDLLPDLLKAVRLSGAPGQPKPGDPAGPPTGATKPPAGDTGKKPGVGDTSPGQKPVGGPVDKPWEALLGFTGSLLDEGILGLVQEVHSNSAKSDEALALLVRKMGLTVVDDNRAPLAQAMTQPRLGLMVAQSELDIYRRMSAEGHRVPLSGLFAAIDFNLEKMGCKLHLQGEVMRQLTRSLWSNNTARRAFAQGLVALGRDKGTDLLSANAGFDPVLDPLQFLLLTRAVTEDIRQIANRKIKPPLELLWAMSGVPPGFVPRQVQGEGIPGWFDDAVAGPLTLISEQVAEHVQEALYEAIGESKDVGQAGSAHQTFGQARNIGAGVAVLLSIVKFAATYAFLKGEWTVEDPPLIRTKKKTEDATTRQIKCKLSFDVPAVLDFMQRNRITLNSLGCNLVDVEMPKREPLSDKRIEWRLEQGDIRHPESFCVRWGSGQNPLDRPTNGEGVTTMNLTGLHQRQKLDEKLAEPYMRKVKVVLYPAVKDSGMKAAPQDMVDIGKDSIGLLSGPLGILDQIFETVYRARWIPAASTKIDVKDWVQPGSWTAAWEMSATGDGTVLISDSKSSTIRRTWSVIHALQTYTMVFENMGPSTPPKVPSAADLARMQPEQRKQMEAMINSPEFQEMINTRTYFAGGEAYQHHVADSERDDMYMVDACGPPPPDTEWSQASLFWEDSKQGWWDPEEVLKKFPHRDSPLLSLQLKIDLRSGHWRIEGSEFPVLAYGDTKSSRDPASDKTGLLYIPLIPGKVEVKANEKAVFEPEGQLPPDILEVMRDPRKAKDGASYRFEINTTFQTWRVFSTDKGEVRQPASVKSHWIFEYHPGAVQ